MTSLFAEALHMVRQDAPWFSKQIKAAQKAGTAMQVSLDAFDDNPLLLYAALWVASRAGVEVRFVPFSETPPHE